VDEVTSLREEIERLAQDNMRLRLESQRPLSLGKVAADLQRVALAADPLEADMADTEDNAYHLLAQAHVIRSEVLNVVQTLQVAARQLERQLVTGVHLMEVDRRVLPQRRATDPQAHRIDASVDHDRGSLTGPTLRNDESVTETHLVPWGEVVVARHRSDDDPEAHPAMTEHQDMTSLQRGAGW